MVEQLQRLSPEGADSQATAEVCIDGSINHIKSSGKRILFLVNFLLKVSENGNKIDY